MPFTAYLGFGSNLGNKKGNILLAYEALSRRGIRIIRESKFYKTAPYGYENQPEFVNSVAQVETEVGALKLLEIIKETERELGRMESFRWGPRIIDIDILFFDEFVVRSEILNIPHIDLHNRCFVLFPLSELAPDLIHPVLKSSITELLKNCTGKVEKLNA